MKDFTNVSPLKVLEHASRKALGAGNLGVLIARAGVGKTACLIHIAFDKIFRKEKLVHLSLGEGPENADDHRFLQTACAHFKLLFSKGNFSNRNMNVCSFIKAELDTTGFCFFNRARKIFGLNNSAGFWIGHQTAGSQDASEAPDLTHHIRGGDYDVTVEPSALDLLDELRSNEVGPCRLGLLGLVPRGRLEADPHRPTVGIDDADFAVVEVNLVISVHLTHIVRLHRVSIALNQINRKRKGWLP